MIGQAIAISMKTKTVLLHLGEIRRFVKFHFGVWSKGAYWRIFPE